MAERKVEQVIEDERRAAVSAIAEAGRQAQGTVRNTSTGIAQAGASVLRDQNAVSRPYDVAGLASELRQIVAPAVDRSWGRENMAFEARQNRDMQGSARDFFAGARTATPIVQSHADAQRAAAEADLLNQALQQELGAGQGVFAFKQALEQRQRAREQMEFERQAHAQQMALAQEQLAFQRAQAAEAARADAGGAGGGGYPGYAGGGSSAPRVIQFKTTLASRKGRGNFGSGRPSSPAADRRR
jgi:hypothetical protein